MKNRSFWLYPAHWTGLLLCLLATAPALAQSSKHIVQFYGIIFYEDSVSGAIGAHIYQTNTYRGTSTDQYGYFSLPVAVGDSMHISYQGYRRQSFRIPPVEGDRYSALFYLEADTTQLDAIQVASYMTERQFKRAVLNFGASRSPFYVPFSHLSYAKSPSSSESYIQFVQQQRQQYNMRYNPNYIPLTDVLLKPLIRMIQRRNKRR